MIILSIICGIYVISIIVVFVLILTAPYGYEDKDGFHRIK